MHAFVLVNLGSTVFFFFVVVIVTRYSDVIASVKDLVEDSHRFVGTAPASQP